MVFARARSVHEAGSELVTDIAEKYDLRIIDSTNSLNFDSKSFGSKSPFSFGKSDGEKIESIFIIKKFITQR